ncbi:cation transporter [Rickettsiella grylli]|uniref:cation diffusion facilitator family transporter n=1 Tax=Rickettsiella grylli TaxID=59196 RepID=UPI0008FD73C5|nr:cation diffusion facilitator family transporter [Rickettsiella grylli]OJA00929.1 cation transporter [Rickettsiella grylli]
MKIARYHQTRAIALWGGLKNLLLAGLKIIFGIIGHSHGLLADGVHSLSDLMVDLLVIIASKFGNKAADENHPYGHGRIETAATVLLAILLALAALAIIVNAVTTIHRIHVKETPSQIVLWIALSSILLNELIYFWTKHIAIQIKSNLLMSNAWHHRSDSFSSMAVAFGVVGAWLGFPKLDAVAAIVVGLMILKTAWNFGWYSIRELVDTALSTEETEKIKRFIKKVSGVKAIHQLRTRSIAGSIFCDVHVLVDPFITVSEGHYIGQEVEKRLIASFPDITDVTVHIDTEDDELTSPSYNLPDRPTLQKMLLHYWRDLLPEAAIQTAIFHYLEGEISIELKLPFNFSNQNDLEAKLKKVIETEKSITTIKIFYYK